VPGSIGELRTESIHILNQSQIPDSEIDTDYMLEKVTGIPHHTMKAHLEQEMTKEQEDLFQSMLLRRKNREPLQQIFGEWDFMGLPFKVTRDVLCPRPDTESLVEQCLNRMDHKGMRFLDMCTGSGCILISLIIYGRKKLGAKPGELYGLGVDVSEKALSVARENAAINHLDLSVVDRESGETASYYEFARGDLFRLKGQNLSEMEPFDFIVSNPPYIRSGEVGILMPEVSKYEPKKALDGGKDGLDFYRRIVADAPLYLKNGGFLAFEIGHDQGPDVKALMEHKGYKNVQVYKDLSYNDRVVIGENYV